MTVLASFPFMCCSCATFELSKIASLIIMKVSGLKVTHDSLRNIFSFKSPSLFK